MTTITRANARRIAIGYIAPDAPALTALGTFQESRSIPDHLLSRLSFEVDECLDLPGLTHQDLCELRSLGIWADAQAATIVQED